MENKTAETLFIITILFCLLKLFKVISWGWIWVLFPLWFPLVVPIVAVLIGFVIVLLITVISVLGNLFR